MDIEKSNYYNNVGQNDPEMESYFAARYIEQLESFFVEFKEEIESAINIDGSWKNGITSYSLAKMREFIKQ